MKKTLLVIALMVTASCSNNQELINIPDQTTINTFSNQNNIAYWDKVNNSTIVNKEPAIKRLSKNEISIEKTSLLEPTEELYVVKFSEGKGVGAIGELVMYIQKSGTAQLAMRGNYYANKPTELNFKETKQILESATNYKANADKLDKLLKQAVIKENINVTRVIKGPAIERLTNNEITLTKTSNLEPTDELYVVRFSSGRNVGGVGELVMYIQKSGTSRLATTGNYSLNIPAKLTLEETKALIIGSSNYKENSDKFKKIF